ncbi:phage tail tape measure protein [Streptomyces sp. NPDC101115]|uniref:phage tail tape measure protein n=1 Tax=Streptomyces sp. NPDC101115 TaxID=3366106 RepID=UPI003800968B
MATAAVEVGVGYVSVVPSARGFAEELQRQIGRSTVTVGTQVGEQSGQAASQGMLSSLGAGLKAGLAGVAVAGAAVFTAAFSKAIEQDKSNARLAAQLGLSPKEADRVGKIAGSIYAKGYGESIDQVNESLRTLAQNGVVAINAPQKDLQQLTKSALNLAETFEVEVGDAARAAGQLIKTGMVKDAGAAFDLITRGFQTGADKSGDMLDTLNEYSTQFRDLGLTGAQAVGLLTQGLQAGARDSDIVADSLKEFAIRAKDGSDTTKEGFDAIGLSAAAMAQAFAKGGPQAATALDQVLDRLRAIPDPVKRSQTAVLLFGTQAEDLQQSLFSLDPSSAVAALGKVTGAADSMGKTLHKTATNDIDVFIRQFMQGLVGVINRNVLPAVAAFGSFLMSDVLPAIRAVANGFAAGVGWLQEYGAWLLPLGVAVAGLTITLNASAIATAAVTAVFSIYRGVILAAAAVTRGYAVVQGLLNAVMTANPIGLIITGIATLVTLLVVAYNKSDRFRAIVQATWAGIQAGWSVLWDNVLKPGLDGLMIGLRAIGAAASWLWSTVLSPVFSAIGLAARVLFAIVATILIAPLVILFRALGAVAGWLWRVAIKPAFAAIGAGASWLFSVAVKPAIDGIMAGVRVLGSVITWLWSNVVRPSLSAIGSFFGWLYRVAVKPAIDGVMTTVRALGAGIGWLWNNAVRPSLQFIGDKASWLYRVALKPALDRGRQAVELFARGFSLARDAIGKAWDQLMGIAKKPVNFIIEWVYTKGIKAVWDKIAGFVGLGSLPAAPKLLAAGGTVGPEWGPAAPMVTNRPTAIVGEGNPAHPEFVIPTDPKYRGRALALWQAAGTQLMADGGIIGGAVDWLGGAARKIGGAVMSGVDFLSDPSKMWERATKFIRDKIAQIGQSRWAQLLAKFPLKMLGGLKDKIVKAAASMFGGASGDIGGSGVQRWTPVVLQALRMVGQPASLLPVVLRRMNQESGGNPRAINNWDINAKNGDPSRGLMQTIGATFNAYAGPLRGRGIYDPLANIYASMRYALARYGSLASAYNRPGGYAAGGRTRRGEWAWVGELGPELVRFGAPATVYPHDESMRMAAGMAGARAAAAVLPSSRFTPAAAGAAAGGGLRAGDRLALRVRDREFEAYVEELADGVVEETLIPVARAIAGRRG